jgi:NADH-quinone oxidoreductase subunit J
METLASYFFCFITVFCAFLVLLTPKLMHKAYALLLTLLGVAGIFVLNRADFIAASQIMVYAGGILILIIFNLLFTSDTHTKVLPSNNIFGTILLVIVVNILSFGLLYLLQLSNLQLDKTSPQTFSTLQIIATELLTTYMVAVEIVGVLLLVVLAAVALLNSQHYKVEK